MCVRLQLNPAYAGKTCGLCGNYNGNQGDDFLTVGGLVETRVEGFGNAWKMNADCDDVQLQHSDPCILNPKRGIHKHTQGCDQKYSILVGQVSNLKNLAVKEHIDH